MALMASRNEGTAGMLGFRLVGVPMMYQRLLIVTSIGQ